MMIDTARRRGWIRTLCVLVVLMAGSAAAGWRLGRTGVAEARDGAGARREDRAQGSDAHVVEALGEEGGQASGNVAAGAHSVVGLSDEDAGGVGIEFATAGPGALQLRIELPGEIVVDPDRLAHIVPRSAAIVHRVEKSLGDQVAAGDVLAWLESEKLGEAKAEYLSKTRRLELARTDLEREQVVHDDTSKLLEMLEGRPSLEELREMGNIEAGENRARLVSAYAKWILAESVYTREKRLFERKISSGQDFLTAESDYKQADAAYLALRDTVRFTVGRALLEARRSVDVADLELQATERRLHILGLTDGELDVFGAWAQDEEKLAWYALRSPFDGTIIEKHISQGELLSTDSDVFEVANLERVWINLSVYQRDLGRIQRGQAVVVAADHGSPVAEGTISWVAPVVDVQTRTAIARVVLANRDGILRPGLYVTGSVTVATVESDVVIPSGAVQALGDESVVFVSVADGLEPRPVRIGRADAEHVEVLEGLAPGERFVSRGAFTLKSEFEKVGFEAGHGH